MSEIDIATLDTELVDEPPSPWFAIHQGGVEHRGGLSFRVVSCPDCRGSDIAWQHCPDDCCRTCAVRLEHTGRHAHDRRLDASQVFGFPDDHPDGLCFDCSKIPAPPGMSAAERSSGLPYEHFAGPRVGPRTP